MLFGSSILPAITYIGKAQVQLGEFVRRAYQESGLSEDEWNNLPALDREAKLAAIIYAMRAQAALKGK